MFSNDSDPYISQELKMLQQDGSLTHFGNNVRNYLKLNYPNLGIFPTGLQI